MMSPGDFGRRQKWQAYDVIRVALDGRGVIGFIETNEHMTLQEARESICQSVDDAPTNFQFVLDDGVPISARQEVTQMISSYFPCIKIRPINTRKGVRNAADTNDDDNRAIHKVMVETVSGEGFAIWIPEDYTFQQLRHDCALYWRVPATKVALSDPEGCLWPDHARILSLIPSQDQPARQIVADFCKLSSLGGNTPILPFSNCVSPSKSFSSAVASSPRPVKRGSDVGSAPASPVRNYADPVEELWNVYTYYCVHGDSRELASLRSHHFTKLLRDARVLTSQLTPAVVNIIYTSETKGRSSTSKMTYDEFIKALMKVANVRRVPPPKKFLKDSDEYEARFQHLILDNILLYARRWPTHTWQTNTKRLRQPRAIQFVCKFLEPLLDMFMFYAKSQAVDSVVGTKELFMAYPDFQRFITDFNFANLPLSSVGAAHIFLASCASTPFHSSMLNNPPEEDLDIASSIKSDAAGVIETLRRVLKSVDGLIVYTFADNQVKRLCMGFSAFLDALGRIGLSAYGKHLNGDSLLCFKAVFHHLSRGLSRTRVLEILHNHASTSVYGTRFYRGSVAFTNKFFDMWRVEGSPDYLTVAPPTPSSYSENEDIAKEVASPEKSQRYETTSSPTRRVVLPTCIPSQTSVLVPCRDERGQQALNRLTKAALIHHGQMRRNFDDQDSLVDHEDGLSPLEDDLEELDGEMNQVESSNETADGDTGKKSQSILLEGSLVPDQSDEATLNRSPRSTHALSPRVRSGDLTPKSSTSSLFGANTTLYRSTLRKGALFKKVGQWGNPHRWYVWSSTDLDVLYWRPVNKKNPSSMESLPIRRIKSVVPTAASRPRDVFTRTSNDGKLLRKCFSIVGGDRRLDLEADSEATRDLWIEALRSVCLPSSKA